MIPAKYPSPALKCAVERRTKKGGLSRCIPDILYILGSRLRVLRCSFDPSIDVQDTGSLQEVGHSTLRGTVAYPAIFVAGAFGCSRRGACNNLMKTNTRQEMHLPTAGGANCKEILGLIQKAALQKGTHPPQESAFPRCKAKLG